MNKIYFKYYTNSIIKNKINITIFFFLIISGLVLNSIIGSDQIKNYTLIFILPSIFWMVIVPMVFAIEFYAKSKINGSELMFASKPLKRTATVLLRTIAMFIVTFLTNLLLISITFIPAIIRTNDFEMFMKLWLIIFIASFLIISFFISLFSLLCSHFTLIPAIIISLLFAVVFSLGSLGSRMLISSSSHNKLEWREKNRVNYAQMIKVNNNGKTLLTTHVMHKGSAKDENIVTGDDSINTVSPFISWANPGEWVINPISSIFGKSYKRNEDEYVRASEDSYKFSLNKIKNKKTLDASTIALDKDKQQWVFVSEQDFNPFSRTKDEIMDQLIKISKNFSKITKDIPIFQGKRLMVWADKLKSDIFWKNISFSNKEKETIQYWGGLKENTHLNMYLIKYYSLLKNKMNNFETILKNKGMPEEHIKLLSLFLKDDSIKSNLLNTNVIMEMTKMHDMFPFMTFKDLKKPAIDSDIEKMKTLINFNLNSKKFRVNLEDGSWKDVDLSVIDKDFSKIQNKHGWDEYINNNNELGTLEKVYEKMKITLMNNQLSMKKINFNDNARDVYAMDTVQEIKSVPFANTFGITSLFLIIATIALFVILIKTYKNKNIS